jgi:hypothetical protein
VSRPGPPTPSTRTHAQIRSARKPLMGLLAVGCWRPSERERFAWNAYEVVRQIYHHTDPELAAAWDAETTRDFADESMPLEARRSLAPSPSGPCRSVRGISRTSATVRPKRSAIWLTASCARFRIPTLRAVPHPNPAVFRQAQLVIPRPTHPTLKFRRANNPSGLRIHRTGHESIPNFMAMNRQQVGARAIGGYLRRFADQ